jgi:dTMP kinase
VAEGSIPGQGRFLTFEGGEGAGKSTQVNLLADSLRYLGIDLVTTREPGGSVEAENIRALLVTGEPGRWDPISEALLLYAARRDHWLKLIEPALTQGKWVICDRFSDSTLVYQGIAKGVDQGVLARLHQLALGEIQPDLTILLDLPAETGLSRTLDRESARASGENRFERMGHEFHHSLRAGFVELAAANPARIVTIDASQGVTEVAASVLDTVRSRLCEDEQH